MSDYTETLAQPRTEEHHRRIEDWAREASRYSGSVGRGTGFSGSGSGSGSRRSTRTSRRDTRARSSEGSSRSSRTYHAQDDSELRRARTIHESGSGSSSRRHGFGTLSPNDSISQAGSSSRSRGPVYPGEYYSGYRQSHSSGSGRRRSHTTGGSGGSHPSRYHPVDVMPALPSPIPLSVPTYAAPTPTQQAYVVYPGSRHRPTRVDIVDVLPDGVIPLSPSPPPGSIHVAPAVSIASSRSRSKRRSVFSRIFGGSRR